MLTARARRADGLRVAAPGVSERRSAGFTAKLVVPVAALVSVQAAFFRALDRSWVTNDARMLYVPTARNLLRHGAYSVMDGPPYLPTITKMPGYSLLLGVVDAAFPGRLGALQAVQFALVAITAILVGRIAAQLLNERVGALSAGIVALYPAMGFYAMHPLSETLTCFLVVLHVATLVAFRRTIGAPSSRAATVTAVGAGASLGALVLVRQSFAFLLPIIIVATLVESPRRGWRAPTRRLALVCVTTALITGPWCVRNIAVSGQFLPFGANSGLSLLASARQYAGDHNEQFRPPYLDTISEDLILIDAQLGTPPGTAPGLDEGLGGGPAREAMLDARLSEQAKEELAQLSLADIGIGIPKRLSVLWADPTAMPLFAWIDHVLVAVGFLGAALSVRRRRDLWPLWFIAAYISAFHLVFHVEDRYSLPARPLLFVFAAGCIDQLLRARRPAMTETP